MKQAGSNVGSQLIYGRQPILEALDEKKGFDKLFVQKGAQGEEIMSIRQRAGELSIPVKTVPLEKLNRLTRKNHQGVAGFIALINYYRIEDVLALTYENGGIPLFLLLDGVTDVRNFGAIARSAACYGVHAVIIPFANSAAVNAEAMKASAGALNKIHVCRENPAQAIHYLQLNGIRILASDLKADKTITETDLTSPSVIVIGAEDRGVSQNILQQADERFAIPMSGLMDSLNVSVATGIILYELNRQRSG